MTIIQTDKPLRPRDTDDHYPTPQPFVESAFNLVPSTLDVQRVLDPGAGSGAFGMEARKRYPNCKIAGIETREVPKPIEYNSWLSLSFVGLSIPVQFDLVIGNPPYKFAEDAVRFGWEHLRPGGTMVYLLRLAFLEGQKRYKGLWRDIRPNHIAVCSNRPSFTGDWLWFNSDTNDLLPEYEQSMLAAGLMQPDAIDIQVVDNASGMVVEIIHVPHAEKRFVSNRKTDATAYGFFVWNKPTYATPTLERDWFIPTLSFVLSGDEDAEE